VVSLLTKIPNKSPFFEREQCILSTREFYKQVRGDANWPTKSEARNYFRDGFALFAIIGYLRQLAALHFLVFVILMLVKAVQLLTYALYPCKTNTRAVFSEIIVLPHHSTPAFIFEIHG